VCILNNIFFERVWTCFEILDIYEENHILVAGSLPYCTFQSLTQKEHLVVVGHLVGEHALTLPPKTTI